MKAACQKFATTSERQKLRHKKLRKNASSTFLRRQKQAITTTSSKSRTNKKAARTPIKISLWAPDPPTALPMPLILKWAFPDGARRANVDNWRQLHLLWVPLEPTSWHPNVDHRWDSRSQEAHVARPSCNSVRNCKQLCKIRIVQIFRNGKRISH